MRRDEMSVCKKCKDAKKRPGGRGSAINKAVHKRPNKAQNV